MDRRVHNAIKLSAAVFLLNACGFAAKDKTSNDGAPQSSSQAQLAGNSTQGVCAGGQISYARLTDDEGSHHAGSGHASAQIVRVSHQVAPEGGSVASSKGSCF